MDSNVLESNDILDDGKCIVGDNAYVKKNI